MPVFPTFEFWSSAVVPLVVEVDLLVFQISVHYSVGHYPIRLLSRECIMKPKFVSRQDHHLIAEIDSGVKNAWKWEWLELTKEYEVS